MFEKDGNLIKNKLDNLQITFGTFELLEEDIDIQAIEELDEEVAYTNLDLATSWSSSEKKIVKQQNQILKYLKQLDRREEK